ncbi:MAG: LysM peptidoglycan-binding domain-containing protein [Chloroflexi bacterium]|nr:LysM peptidoglycan-binding domain-containing protein [Chloroflexota bacterium]
MRSRLIDLVSIIAALLIGYGGIGLISRLGWDRPFRTASPVRVVPTPTVAPAVTFTPVPSVTVGATAVPSPSSTLLGATVTPQVTAHPPSPSPTPTPVVYVVQAGDSLEGIAQRFKVTVDAISQANHLADPNRIAEGQRLVIPSGH